MLGARLWGSELLSYELEVERTGAGAGGEGGVSGIFSSGNTACLQHGQTRRDFVSQGSIQWL